MREQSKAARRRAKDWHFTQLYLVGDGIDIGCGNDSIENSRAFFPRLGAVRNFDQDDGDIYRIESPAPYDWVHSSHCLEHLRDPFLALRHWVTDLLRSDGHAILTVPDFRMYEHGTLPSRFGVGHQVGFSVEPLDSMKENVCSPLSWLRHLPVSLERFAVIREHFDDTLSATIDQTLGEAECSIEIVLRRL